MPNLFNFESKIDDTKSEEMNIENGGGQESKFMLSGYDLH